MSIDAGTKRRGRPATGKGTQIGVRFQPADLAKIDEWRLRQNDLPSRAEAIRRLVEVGFEKN